jgi:uncharacterized membrane protein YfcA
MDFWSFIAPVVAVLFVSALSRGLIGFGNALVAMPLLALFAPIQIASPLVGLANLTGIMIILAGNWRSVNLKAAWRLILACLIGIPIGLFFIKTANEKVVRIVLGAILVGYGLYNLISPRLPYLKSELFSWPFGLASGILGGAFNSNGPPIVIYGSLRRWSPGSFRATLQGVFLPTNLMIIVSHALAGLWTRDVLTLYAYSLPLMLLATLIGIRFGKRIPKEQFHRIVYGFLGAMGALLIVRA